MLLEKIATDAPVTLAPRRKRSPGERLVEALRSLARGHGDVLSHCEASWASITFSGKRHSLRLLFDGVTAAEAGEGLIAALPDHEFAIPGQLVADAAVIEADHRLLPDERLEVLVEVLMLDDG
jgi:hypothetical protein